MPQEYAVDVYLSVRLEAGAFVLRELPHPYHVYYLDAKVAIII